MKVERVSPVQVSNSDDLSSHIVVQSVSGAGVDEAVTYPEARPHSLWDLPQHLVSSGIRKGRSNNIKMPLYRETSRLLTTDLKGCLQPILRHLRLGLLGRRHYLWQIAQHKEGLFCRDANKLARVGPKDLSAQDLKKGE